MRPRFYKVALSLVALVATFVAGYSVGRVTGFRWGMGQLGTETQGNLNQRIETLARLRTGDPEGAIELLERSVDIATASLPQRKPWLELSEPIQRTLMLAKVYREAYPPDERGELSAEVLAVLSMAPLPEVRYCSPALRQVMQQARARVEAQD